MLIDSCRLGARLPPEETRPNREGSQRSVIVFLKMSHGGKKEKEWR